MPSMLPVFSEGFLVVIPLTLLCSNVLTVCSGALGPPLHPQAGAQALSIVSSLQEIKMDKLRGRVRAGSQFSGAEMLTFRRGWADGTPGPIMGARVRGAATLLLPRQGIPDPGKSRVSAASVAQPNSFISRVGEGRREKER